MKIGGGVRYLLFTCVRGVGKLPERKRETEKKGNTPVNTGPSPNTQSVNTQVEEADEPARGSGPLHFKL
ncbi:hypothetical protein T03_3490 [Trichinella britovi]|uniref:Uncharacterized protein n=1 Tax=Trichinella britovi TaxID=45882 RepID=A0A0V1D0Q5_TRIBR|nr:hypothetical protein T03_3490 [Trichinella britovi]